MNMIDILGCVGWAAFLLLVSAFIPLVGPLISLLTPLPFLFYSTKLGFRKGLQLAFIAAVLIGLIGNWIDHPQLIIFCGEFSLLGIALSICFNKRLGIGETVFCATGFMLFLGFLVLLVLALMKGMAPLELVPRFLDSQLKATLAAYKEMGISPENVTDLEAYGKVFINAVLKIYPSLMVIGTGFAVWLNVIIARPVFNKGNLEYPAFGPADHWKATDNMVWGVIVSGFLLLLTSGVLKILALNVLIVLMAIYCFHGLSIVLFFFNKYNVPSWIRAGVYFLIIVQQLFLAISALLGLFDQWIDFRRIHKRMPQEQ